MKMHAIGILFFLMLLCSCSMFKKVKKSFKNDTLKVTERDWSSKKDSFLKMSEYNKGTSKQHEVMEIYAEQPYRWHPDSGLFAGAGYIQLKLLKTVEQEKQQQKRVWSNSSEKGKDNKADRVKSSLKVEHKQVSGISSFSIWIIALVMLMLIVGWIWWKMFVK